MPFFEERKYETPLEDIDTSPDIVKIKLQKLKRNKSPGRDKMHPRVLNEIANVIFLPLSIFLEPL